MIMQNTTSIPPPKGEDYVRLHIAPLNPALLKIIVPASVLPRARDISYHSLQTFPDKPYGFIDLPVADALKIKNKLNGAVLKGNKIRIEPARIDKMPKLSTDAVVDPAAEPLKKDKKEKKEKRLKKDKKRKRDAEEIVGVELEEGRQVKRGWTVAPDESKPKRKDKEARDKAKKERNLKKGAKSQYTDRPEALVKTLVPPNKMDLLDDKDKEKEKKRKSKKGIKHNEVVVHEFQKTIKFPTFLKTASGVTGPGALPEYVEGKGWVDETGTVVEEMKSTRPKAPEAPIAKAKKKALILADDDDDTTSSSGSSSEEDESDVEMPDITPKPTSLKSKLNKQDPQVPDAMAPSDSARPKSSSSAVSLTIKIPTPSTPAVTKVHPLEALYKKQQQQDATTPKTKPVEVTESFSFFGGAGAADNEEEEEDVKEDEDASPIQTTQMPMTPFSKQDFDWRNTRSAAPTPDTAHPSRMAQIWSYGRNAEHAQHMEDEAQEDSDGQQSGGEGQDEEPAGSNPNTDFQKWFWENRGNLNRSWKSRRKTAAKEKRYRENRARADKAI